MAILECRRDRLVHVIDLARLYRGWTRQEVAAALGREPAKMIPESGNPKLDLVVGIARLLEWPVGDVADCLWGAEGAVPGLFEGSLDNASAAPGAPGSPHAPGSLGERARACRRQGLEHMAVSLLQQALLDGSLSRLDRAQVHAELAQVHFTLWHLAEARALASELLRQQERGDLPADAAGAVALARVVRGHAQRRLMRMQPEMKPVLAKAACRDLIEGVEGVDAVVLTIDGADLEHLLAAAHTARGGIVECEVETGMLAAERGIDQIMGGLDAVIDPLTCTPGPMLEAWGWWCVYGANLALAHLEGESQNLALGIFTNKVLEIAERSGSWALRERAFSLEHLRRWGAPGALPVNSAPRGSKSSTDDEPLLLDQDQVRALIGTMGRFPAFRPAGWTLLHRATIVE
ncbi:MAG: hypothetical protein KF724_00330 [Phycisphaeraceae bacterium]|nr:hypothetical protein [Phycisphaeraceae bacterium]